MNTLSIDFSTSNVLVVGDLILDRYWHGDTSRISPEAPVPVVKIETKEDRVGGSGNVAMNVASLGGQSQIVALIGQDESADALRSLMNDAGIAFECEAIKGHHTITKLRTMSRNQQLIRLDFEDGFKGVDEAIITQAVSNAITQANVMVLSDYGKGTLNSIPKYIELARQHNVPVFIDPKGTDFSIYQNATLITPNQSEFEAVVGVCENDDELLKKGEALRAELNLDALLVTRSEKGMVLFERDKIPFVQPTRAREVYDVTGAGDTVIATLATAYGSGLSLVDATHLANFAAGIVVAKVGTATVSLDELKQYSMGYTPSNKKICTESQLIEQIKEAKASGDRVVFTNGCFDILHAGHVQYLAQAAALGDRLILAVNSDASVKRLKGDSRPINNVQNRMAVLAGLGSIDWVVSFDEDTPQRLIEACLPDVLVKGGDYKVHEIAGADAVMANGGEVSVLSFLEGCSTTNVIEAIQKG